MNELYRRLAESSNDAVFRCTFDEGRVLMANQGFVKMLDLDLAPSALEGKLLKDLIRYSEKEGTIPEAIEKTGELHGVEYHFKTLKDEDRWVIMDAFS